jgi:hypothetical protein
MVQASLLPQRSKSCACIGNSSTLADAGAGLFPKRWLASMPAIPRAPHSCMVRLNSSFKIAGSTAEELDLKTE